MTDTIVEKDPNLPSYIKQEREVSITPDQYVLLNSLDNTVKLAEINLRTALKAIVLGSGYKGTIERFDKNSITVTLE